jgi:beta-glucanase (GH16 family)
MDDVRSRDRFASSFQKKRILWHPHTIALASLGLGLLASQAHSQTRAEVPEPTLVWHDEFDGPEGAPPDPTRWTVAIGDGSAHGIPGWGNEELEYYTDASDNTALDGKGHLVITARRSESKLPCYYGPCTFTSARVLSQHKAAFQYGRIEARIRVPRGAGLWPAFWSLGTNIEAAGWPACGEIDIMEFVGRAPKDVFGTLHGPGYSGAEGIGQTHSFEVGVYEDFHVFAVEWRLSRIDWYVDGVEYHSASPQDVAPDPWVFRQPFFLLLNLAVGGHFGGPVSDETPFPAHMLVDYVRVYAPPDESTAPVAGDR